MNAGASVQTRAAEVFSLQLLTGLAQLTPGNISEISLECDEELADFSREASSPPQSPNQYPGAPYDEVYEEMGRETAQRGLDEQSWSTLVAHISPMKYAILLDWLCEVTFDHCLTRETFHLALTFIWRFLISSPLPDCDLQLLAVSALSLAAKAEEELAPRLAQLTQSCSGAFSPAQIKAMEQRILATLDWRLYRITPASLLHWLMTRWDNYLLQQNHSTLMFTQSNEESARRYQSAFWVLDASQMHMEVLREEAMECTAAVLYWCVYFESQRDGYSLVGGPGNDTSQLELRTVVDDLYSSFLQQTCGMCLSRIYSAAEFLVPFVKLLSVYDLSVPQPADPSHRSQWCSRQRHFKFTLQSLAAVLKSS